MSESTETSGVLSLVPCPRCGHTSLHVPCMRCGYDPRTSGRGLSRTYRVKAVTVHGDGTLTLHPDDKVFFVSTRVDGQWGRNTDFVVLCAEEANDD